jgi:hypothetical protein
VRHSVQGCKFGAMRYMMHQIVFSSTTFLGEEEGRRRLIRTVSVLALTTGDIIVRGGHLGMFITFPEKATPWKAV